MPAGELPFLVEVWSHVQVDTSGWLVGNSVCTELVVKAANVRLQGLRRMRQGCPMPLLEPIRPAIWGTGLRTTEAKWLSDLADKGLVLRRPVLRAAGTRGALAVEYDAAWMHPPPARAAPRARGAAGGARCARRARSFGRERHGRRLGATS